MTNQNLWPSDIAQATEEKGPIKLLKEQAAFLSEMTDNLVTAEVRAEQQAINGMFGASFYLFGPKINYRYLLFNIYYPLKFYPAHIGFDADRVGETIVEDDEALEKELRYMFEHQQTRQIISAIIARSK